MCLCSLRTIVRFIQNFLNRLIDEWIVIKLENIFEPRSFLEFEFINRKMEVNTPFFESARSLA